jgi:predicted nucleic acid-binding protein
LVRASAVIDIRSDLPREGESLFVDTNVWKNFAYTNASASASFRPQNAGAYAKYVEKCIAKKTSLLYSNLSYSELAHVIETIECEIYNGTRAEGDRVRLKQFRQGDVERLTVVTEMQITWQLVTEAATLLPTAIDDEAQRAAAELFEGFPLDGYDIFYVNAMRAAKVDAILTDDADYIYVPGLRVFTASDTALRMAGAFKKIVVR